METSSTQYDLIVIGAGPAGISLAAEAIQAGIPARRVLILEKGPEHSWSIRKLYPDKLVAANYKGRGGTCQGVLCIPDMSKGEVLTYLDRAISDNELTVHYQEEVAGLHRDKDGVFRVCTSRGEYTSVVCVIAIGIFGRPNPPDYQIPSALRRSTHFDVTSKVIEDQKVLVVGGGDSASEYVQYLVGKGNRVTLSDRKTEFARMTEINRESLLALEQRGEARILRSTNIEKLEDDDGRPRAIFREKETPAETFERLVYALGGTTPKNFLEAIGIGLTEGKPVVSDRHETDVPGLYLIGDLGRTGGSIITAFNSARGAMEAICDDHLGCELPPSPLSRAGGTADDRQE